MTDAATPSQDAEQRLLESVPSKLLIGGEWADGSEGETIEVEDPATGKVLKTIASASPEDGAKALDAACAVQEEWARTAPRTRAEILRKAFDLLQERTEDFALLMTLEMGKPLAESRGEVAYGGEFLRWFSEETARISGRYATAPDGANRLLVNKRPVGPCLLITPWNFPLAMATRKIAPAIAAGCTMVLKPATLTPLTSLLFADLLREAGLPDGVLNVVTAKSASKVTGPLLKDSRLRKLSFTGSTEVGQRLIADSAQRVLRTSMELGGNAPFLVFEDADLEKAVEGAMLAKMRNMGEACTAANRFIVHESVAEEFSAKFAENLAALKALRGTDKASTLGPLVDADSRAKVEELVQDAVSKGATVRTGGKAVEGPGYFYEPTLLTDVAEGSRVLTEEIFGPVAPVVTFSTEAEAVEKANASDFGLVSYVYTQSVNRALRMGERLETGMLGVNAGVVSNPAAPFGGVKMSGIGREGGFEGIEEYLSTQYVGIADPWADAES